MVPLIDIVSSRGKAEIFRLLFGSQPVELHLRELTRQAGLSIGTLQQELKHLVRVGLVAARKDGNRVCYSANPRHPVYPDLRSLVMKTSGLVGVLQGALENPEVRLAFVFGSMAAGEADAESDVDLMVVGSAGLRQAVLLLSGVAERLGREVNPHVMTPEEFRKRVRRRDHFLTSVLASPKVFVKGTEHELEAMGR